jgi:exonuclease SbcD
MRVHVVAAVTEQIEDEVLILADDAGTPELIVCAVPYLRDRDIRKVEAGESYSDKQAKLVGGIQEHYAAAAKVVEARRQELGSHLPAIAMGHLFTAGGQTVEGDGVRELYVGSLAHVPPSMFGPEFDYVALGHLHVPQVVGGNESRRYSGSPIPMNFGESNQEKSVVLVDFNGPQREITLLPVPCFQRLARVHGDLNQIAEGVTQLCRESSPEKTIWLEVGYNGEDVVADLRQRVLDMVQGSFVDVVSVKNLRVTRGQLTTSDDAPSLEDLTPEQVFERCLTTNEISEDQRGELIQTFFLARESYAESIGTTGGRG